MANKLNVFSEKYNDADTLVLTEQAKKQIEAIAKSVSKEEFINSIPSLKFVNLEFQSSGKQDVSQYEPFTCLNFEGQVDSNLILVLPNYVKFNIVITDMDAEAVPYYGRETFIKPQQYAKLGEAGWNAGVIILKNIALILVIDNN